MADAADGWLLDRQVRFLNHGSFGACPAAVIERQRALVRRLEAEPVAFLVEKRARLMHAARAALADFVGTAPAGLVAVRNTTEGVNTVLASLALGRGERVLVTDHGYRACRNAVDYHAGRAGARVDVARVPFPIAAPDAALDAIVDAVRPGTRVALIDHVTSATGLVMPLADIAAALHARGVEVLVDGAHAPGMLALDIDALGVAWYVGNCHKWLCAPKGAAFIAVRDDRREALRPLVISHGASHRPGGLSRLHAEFDWQGTFDPSAFLSVPQAIDTVGALLPGGWPAVMARNRELALLARARLAAALGVEPPAPAAMIGALAAVALPGRPARFAAAGEDPDPIARWLRQAHRIQVPVFPFEPAGQTLVRVSAQLYNTAADYDALAAALASLYAAAA